MFTKIYKAVAYTAILVCGWSIWTNFGFYLAMQNFKDNPTEAFLAPVVDSGEASDQARVVIFVLFICTFLLNIIATNIIYNRAKSKIVNYDLLVEFPKKRAIGSWFIPFGNLILPRLRLHELELILRSENRAYEKSNQIKDRNKDGEFWWFSWIAYILLNRGVVAYFESEIDSVTEIPDIARLTNLYLIGISMTTVLLIVAMIYGMKYFDHLFNLESTATES